MFGTDRKHPQLRGLLNSEASRKDQIRPMELATQKESRWYAVSTRSRHEKTAASMLESLGIRHFLPLITEVRRWSDRKQAVVSPLFSCYLFVNISNSPESRLRVLKVPGIVSLVGNMNGPVPIPEREIESVRLVLSQGIEYFPYPYLQAGDRVRIVQGALAGVEGTFVRSGPNATLVISIEMIRQSVAIKIDGCDVEPVPDGSAPNSTSMRLRRFTAHVA